jgi:hypothetical protein
MKNVEVRRYNVIEGPPHAALTFACLVAKAAPTRSKMAFAFSVSIPINSGLIFSFAGFVLVCGHEQLLV